MAPADRGDPASSAWTCLLCGHGRYVIETRGPDYEYACSPGVFTLARCAQCGHVSLHPIPEPGGVAALYPPTYYTVNSESPLYLKGFIYESKIRRDVKRICSYMDVTRFGSIIDIGSGDAARLFELRKTVPKDTECIALDL